MERAGRTEQFIHIYKFPVWYAYGIVFRAVWVDTSTSLQI